MSSEPTGDKMNNQRDISPQAKPPSPDKSKLPEGSVTNDLSSNPEPQPQATHSEPQPQATHPEPQPQATHSEPQPQATQGPVQMKGRCIRAGLPDCPNRDRDDVPLWTGNCYRCHTRGRNLNPKKNAEHNSFCEKCAWGYGIGGRSLQCPKHKKTAYPQQTGYRPEKVYIQ